MRGASIDNKLTPFSSLEEEREFSSIQTPPVVEPSTKSRCARVLRKMRRWAILIVFLLSILVGAGILCIFLLPTNTTQNMSNQTLTIERPEKLYTPLNEQCMEWTILDTYNNQTGALRRKTYGQATNEPDPDTRKKILELLTTNTHHHGLQYSLSCFTHLISFNKSEDLSTILQQSKRVLYDAFSSYKEGATLEQYLKETPVDPQNYYSLLFDALKNFSLTPKEIALVSQTEHTYHKNCGEEISRRIVNLKRIRDKWTKWLSNQGNLQDKLTAYNSSIFYDTQNTTWEVWDSLSRKLQEDQNQLNKYHKHTLVKFNRGGKQ
ncbi:hypothetical protein NEDG_01357 [Nematocida displodere]|uniref:Uncharacterized protein n=1 Tax=Nematocida displodere TaxID=1805483 RepID=A0A177EBF7_9MICR|nr:hypothetical protein NEDG_01357 [Nematocida displodere]